MKRPPGQVQQARRSSSVRPDAKEALPLEARQAHRIAQLERTVARLEIELLNQSLKMETFEKEVGS